MPTTGPPPPLPGDRPLPSSFDNDEDFYNENGFQKIARKLKQEPLVPLGCVLTVAAFTGAYRAMRAGDHGRVNRMFRYRIAAQGFTILAMVAGGIYYSDDRHKEREMWKAKREADEEDKRQRWIRELEARDEEDKLAKEIMDKRRQRAAAAAAKREGKAAVEDKPADGAAAAAAQDAKSSSGLSWSSVPGWFGGDKTDPNSNAQPNTGDAEKPTEK
ncbi:uncharacterized protein PgNI_07647 [Pyricularia grisea]|uniref:HIG1 domain-containing protein n=1 Tax=Pyricularia grisea TaxID=148305 RepID=A0A6P8B1U6_PYRGI|nr:uncharacterized protein PgNI_07647 [Pyricularia grisea]TLD08821.1 hypothetical protein PgNI_07647 [Pyricularia grisea]